MTDTLVSALIKAQHEIDNAHKDAKNPFFKSNYATLESVIEAVKQPLLDNGVLFVQKSSISVDGVNIETCFYGHGEEIQTGQLHVPADKQDPQGYGSALTYARRYSLAMACGIGAGIKVEATGADDDGNKATTTYQAKTAKKLTEGKYKINAVNGITNESTNAVVVATDDETKYLEHCRSFLKDPKSNDCKAIFKANKKSIKAAMVASEGDTKEAFEKLLGIYEANES